jgi:hypothetical protein
LKCTGIKKKLFDQILNMSSILFILFTLFLYFLIFSSLNKFTSSVHQLGLIRRKSKKKKFWKKRSIIKIHNAFHLVFQQGRAKVKIPCLLMSFIKKHVENRFWMAKLSSFLNKFGVVIFFYVLLWKRKGKTSIAALALSHC